MRLEGVWRRPARGLNTPSQWFSLGGGLRASSPGGLCVLDRRVGPGLSNGRKPHKQEGELDAGCPAPPWTRLQRR